MTKRTWELSLEDGKHTVELEHGYFSGKKRVTVDGQVVCEKQNVVDFGGQYPFTVGEHSVWVQIGTNGLTFSYDLVLDGVSQQTGQKMTLLLPVPRWAWAFFAASALIPIVTRGGAVPAAIGVGSALVCARVVRDSQRSTAARVALCLAVIAVAWLLLLGFAAAFVALGR